MIDEPKCRQRSCRHYRGLAGSNEIDQRPICAAFPSGIPGDIAFGNNPHIDNVAGDRGIVYEHGETEIDRQTRLAREQVEFINQSLRNLSST